MIGSAADGQRLSGGPPAELVERALRLAAAPWAHPEYVRRVVEERLDSGFDGSVAGVFEVLERGRPPPDDVCVRRVVERLLRAGAKVLLPGHDGYPPRLAQAWPELGAPCWLFALGACLRGPLFRAPAVGVVGTRRPSLDGLRTARALGRLLGHAGVLVVSGLARGIDQAAHRGALDAGGATVAVLGTGFGVDYPAGAAPLRREIADSGGLLTELVPGASPKPHHFLWRNRIISGLSDLVVVVEGRARSGALQTARLAAAQGREVLAVPGSINDDRSRAPLDLIRDGARPLTRLDDVLDALGDLPRADAPPREQSDRLPILEPASRQVLDLLGASPAGIGDLASASGRTAAEVLAAVADLETRGLAHTESRGVVRAPVHEARGARPTG